MTASTLTPPMTTPRRPTVSVIMPIRNEADFIQRSLRAVLNQDYPRELMEVLVADGSSTDRTLELVRSVAAEHAEIDVRIVDNPRRIVATGFNTALGRAAGDVIIRVDGHTVIAPDYVRQCVAALERSQVENVGGRMNPVGSGLFHRAVSLATSSRFGIGGARFHYSDREELVDTVFLGAWPRRVFQEYGLFDEEQIRNQDDEFNYRVRSLGGRILLSPRIKSRYFNRSAPLPLVRQYFQYGYWKVRVMQKHPRQMRPRHFAPFLFVSILLVTLFAAPFSVIAARVFLWCIGIYLIANIIASVLVALRRPLSTVNFLPLTFCILHVAYGSGFLFGLFRFWNRWSLLPWRERPKLAMCESLPLRSLRDE